MSQNTEFETDISPAIRALKTLHMQLLEHVKQHVPARLTKGKGFETAKDAVVTIIPGDRRREDGHYRWKTWEKKSDQILHELNDEYKIRFYHEIYIVGEALSREMDDIVLLMMHQVAHQAAHVESVQSYHAEWIKIWMHRLFGIPGGSVTGSKIDAWTRDEVLGWNEIDKSKLGSAKKLVDSLAATLNPVDFDLFRRKMHARTTYGKMYKWVCACKKPVVRTGGILYATCDKCGEMFKIVDAPTAFLKRVPDERRA